jgi:hypothetical protein
LNSGLLLRRRPEWEMGYLLDGLLLGKTRPEEDVFLLFGDLVVLCSFDALSSHLLNKCNKFN